MNSLLLQASLRILTILIRNLCLSRDLVKVRLRPEMWAATVTTGKVITLKGLGVASATWIPHSKDRVSGQPSVATATKAIQSKELTILLIWGNKTQPIQGSSKTSITSTLSQRINCRITTQPIHHQCLATIKIISTSTHSWILTRSNSSKKIKTQLTFII